MKLQRSILAALALATLLGLVISGWMCTGVLAQEQEWERLQGIQNVTVPEDGYLDEVNAAYQDKPDFQTLVDDFTYQLNQDLNRTIAELPGVTKPADQVAVEDIPQPDTPEFEQLLIPA